MNINTAERRLRIFARRADANKNRLLATQEVRQSNLPKEAKKVLSQAISNAANSAGGQAVKNVQRWVHIHCDEFRAADTDHSGRLSNREISKAKGAYGLKSRLRALEKFCGRPTREV